MKKKNYPILQILDITIKEHYEHFHYLKRVLEAPFVKTYYVYILMLRFLQFEIELMSTSLSNPMQSITGNFEIGENIRER